MMAAKDREIMEEKWDYTGSYAVGKNPVSVTAWGQYVYPMIQNLLVYILFKQLQREFGEDFVLGVYVFGATANGDVHDKSDVDMRIHFSQVEGEAYSKVSEVVQRFEELEKILLDKVQKAGINISKLHERNTPLIMSAAGYNVTNLEEILSYDIKEWIAGEAREDVKEVLKGFVSSPIQEQGGYIEEVHKVASEGSEIVLRVVANKEDEDGNRHVLLYSNMGPEGQWQEYKELMEFVENKKGRAIYEIKFKAKRNFEYTVAFEGEDGELEWADLPYGNGQVHVYPPFKGHLAFVGMEFAPFIKVGGAGDVIFELPKALVERGNEVSVIMPYFKAMEEKLVKGNYEVKELKGIEIGVPFKDRATEKMTVKVTEVEGITVYMLNTASEDLFVEPYTDKETEFYESIMLSRGSLELLKKIDKKVDIVHSNDHHTALVPVYMRTLYAKEFEQTGSVFTIHNIGYQGEYDIKKYKELGLPETEQMKKLLIKSGEINLMAGVPGVIKMMGEEGNYINTVSPTYAREIVQTEFEIDRLLHDVGVRFGGILNGIDFSSWDPATDKYIAANYSIKDGIENVLAARAKNKQALQELLAEDGDISKVGIKDARKKYGALEVGSERLLVGGVSRLVGQKQLDILANILDDMYEEKKEELDVDIVLLGSGEKWLEEELARMVEDKRKKRINISIAFVRAYSEQLAHMIYAGADALLVPSDYEPSGLTQMIAMRYGAVPIVRKTGGLADTVFELGKEWTGFVFDGESRPMGLSEESSEELLKKWLEEDAGCRKINADQLYEAIGRAVKVYDEDKEEWARIIENAMKADNDWARSLGDYMNVYAWLKGGLNSLVSSPIEEPVENVKVGQVAVLEEYEGYHFNTPALFGSPDEVRTKLLEMSKEHLGEGEVPRFIFVDIDGTMTKGSIRGQTPLHLARKTFAQLYRERSTYQAARRMLSTGVNFGRYEIENHRGNDDLSLVFPTFEGLGVKALTEVADQAGINPALFAALDHIKNNLLNSNERVFLVPVSRTDARIADILLDRIGVGLVLSDSKPLAIISNLMETEDGKMTGRLFNKRVLVNEQTKAEYIGRGGSIYVGDGEDEKALNGSVEYFVNIRSPENEVNLSVKDETKDAEAQRNPQQLGSSPVSSRKIPGLIAKGSWADIGAYVKWQEDHEGKSVGKISYRNSWENLIKVMPGLQNAQGLYMYGLYSYKTGAAHKDSNDREKSIARKIHTYPNGDPHMTVSRNTYVKSPPYEGKKVVLKDMKLSNGNGHIEFVDRDNPFSHGGMLKDITDPESELNLNPKVFGKREAEVDFNELKKHKEHLITDMIVWLASDAVNETNYKLTFYIDEDMEGEIAQDLAQKNEEFRKLRTEKEKEDFIKEKILWGKIGDEFAAKRILKEGKERVILVKRANIGISSQDQVMLNVWLPEVQQYLIGVGVKWGKKGKTGLRVDLAGKFLNKNMQEYLFFATPEQKRRTVDFYNQGRADKDKLVWEQITHSDVPLELEPLNRVIQGVNTTLAAEGKTMDWIMEAYENEDKRGVERLLDFDLSVKVYDRYVFEAYIENNAERLARALDFAWKHKGRYVLFPSNYDEESLVQLQGSRDGFLMILIAMAYLGVPVMVGLREWMGHYGHMITIPGGVDRRGKITHPFVRPEELERRENIEGVKKELEEGPMNRLIQSFFKMVPEGEIKNIKIEHQDSKVQLYFDVMMKEAKKVKKTIVVNMNFNRTKKMLTAEEFTVRRQKHGRRGSILNEESHVMEGWRYSWEGNIFNPGYFKIQDEWRIEVKREVPMEVLEEKQREVFIATQVQRVQEESNRYFAWAQDFHEDYQLYYSKTEQGREIFIDLLTKLLWSDDIRLRDGGLWIIGEDQSLEEAKKNLVEPITTQGLYQIGLSMFNRDSYAWGDNFRKFCLLHKDKEGFKPKFKKAVQELFKKENKDINAGLRWMNKQLGGEILDEGTIISSPIEGAAFFKVQGARLGADWILEEMEKSGSSPVKGKEESSYRFEHLMKRYFGNLENINDSDKDWIVDILVKRLEKRAQSSDGKWAYAMASDFFRAFEDYYSTTEIGHDIVIQVIERMQLSSIEGVVLGGRWLHEMMGQYFKQLDKGNEKKRLPKELSEKATKELPASSPLVTLDREISSPRQYNYYTGNDSSGSGNAPQFMRNRRNWQQPKTSSPIKKVKGIHEIIIHHIKNDRDMGIRGWLFMGVLMGGALIGFTLFKVMRMGRWIVGSRTRFSRGHIKAAGFIAPQRKKDNQAQAPEALQEEFEEKDGGSSPVTKEQKSIENSSSPAKKTMEENIEVKGNSNGATPRMKWGVPVKWEHKFNMDTARYTLRAFNRTEQEVEKAIKTEQTVFMKGMDALMEEKIAAFNEGWVGPNEVAVLEYLKQSINRLIKEEAVSKDWAIELGFKELSEGILREDYVNERYQAVLSRLISKGMIKSKEGIFINLEKELLSRVQRPYKIIDSPEDYSAEEIKKMINAEIQKTERIFNRAIRRRKNRMEDLDEKKEEKKSNLLSQIFLLQDGKRHIRQGIEKFGKDADIAEHILYEMIKEKKEYMENSDKPRIYKEIFFEFLKVFDEVIVHLRGHPRLNLSSETWESAQEKVSEEIKRFDEALRERFNGSFHEYKEIIAKKIPKVLKGYLEKNEKEMKQGTLEKTFKSMEELIEDEYKKYIKDLKESEKEAFREEVLDLTMVILDSRLKSLDSKDPVIIFAKEMDKILYDEIIGQYSNVAAFVVEKTTVAAHWVILAKEAGMLVITESLSGGDEDIFDLIEKESYVVVDGMNGKIVLNPSVEVMQKVKNIDQYRKALEIFSYDRRNESVITLDGWPVEFSINAQEEDEVSKTHDGGIENIGLFRSEGRRAVYYLNIPLSEKNQIEDYSKAANKTKGYVTIRTWDIVSPEEDPDKVIPWMPYDGRIGTEAYRKTKGVKEIFLTQLRALVKANIESERGNIRVMFPMLVSSEDVDFLRESVEEVKKSLLKEYTGNKKVNIEARERIKAQKFGAMIEHPVFWEDEKLLDNLLASFDFASIGTSDYKRFLFDVSRKGGNSVEKSKKKRFAGVQPEAIRHYIHYANKIKEYNQKYDKDFYLSICGTIASMFPFTVVFLALLGEEGGRVINSIDSMGPIFKEFARNVSVEEAREVVGYPKIPYSSEEFNEKLAVFVDEVIENRIYKKPEYKKILTKIIMSASSPVVEKAASSVKMELLESYRRYPQEGDPEDAIYLQMDVFKDAKARPAEIHVTYRNAMGKEVSVNTEEMQGAFFIMHKDKRIKLNSDEIKKEMDFKWKKQDSKVEVILSEKVRALLDHFGADFYIKVSIGVFDQVMLSQENGIRFLIPGGASVRPYSEEDKIIELSIKKETSSPVEEEAWSRIQSLKEEPKNIWDAAAKIVGSASPVREVLGAGSSNAARFNFSPETYPTGHQEVLRALGWLDVFDSGSIDLNIINWFVRVVPKSLQEVSAGLTRLIYDLVLDIPEVLESIESQTQKVPSKSLSSLRHGSTFRSSSVVVNLDGALKNDYTFLDYREKKLRDADPEEKIALASSVLIKIKKAVGLNPEDNLSILRANLEKYPELAKLLILAEQELQEARIVVDLNLKDLKRVMPWFGNIEGKLQSLSNTISYFIQNLPIIPDPLALPKLALGWRGGASQSRAAVPTGGASPVGDDHKKDETSDRLTNYLQALRDFMGALSKNSRLVRKIISREIKRGYREVHSILKSSIQRQAPPVSRVDGENSVVERSKLRNTFAAKVLQVLSAKVAVLGGEGVSALRGVWEQISSGFEFVRKQGILPAIFRRGLIPEMGQYDRDIEKVKGQIADELKAITEQRGSKERFTQEYYSLLLEEWRLSRDLEIVEAVNTKHSLTGDVANIRFKEAVRKMGASSISTSPISSDGEDASSPVGETTNEFEATFKKPLRVFFEEIEQQGGLRHFIAQPEDRRKAMLAEILDRMKKNSGLRVSVLGDAIGLLTRDHIGDWSAVDDLPKRMLFELVAVQLDKNAYDIAPNEVNRIKILGFKSLAGMVLSDRKYGDSWTHALDDLKKRLGIRPTRWLDSFGMEQGIKDDRHDKSQALNMVPLSKAAYEYLFALSMKDQKALIARMREGSHEARNTLVEIHLPIVKELAKSIGSAAVTRNELISFGVEEMIHLVDGFVVSNGDEGTNLGEWLLEELRIRMLRYLSKLKMRFVRGEGREIRLDEHIENGKGGKSTERHETVIVEEQQARMTKEDVESIVRTLGGIDFYGSELNIRQLNIFVDFALSGQSPADGRMIRKKYNLSPAEFNSVLDAVRSVLSKSRKFRKVLEYLGIDMDVFMGVSEEDVVGMAEEESIVSERELWKFLFSAEGLRQSRELDQLRDQLLAEDRWASPEEIFFSRRPFRKTRFKKFGPERQKQYVMVKIRHEVLGAMKSSPEGSEARKLYNDYEEVMESLSQDRYDTEALEKLIGVRQGFYNLGKILGFKKLQEGFVSLGFGIPALRGILGGKVSIAITESFKELNLNYPGFSQWGQGHELDGEGEENRGRYYAVRHVKERILLALREEWKADQDDLYLDYNFLIPKMRDGEKMEYLDAWFKVREGFYELYEHIRDDQGQTYQNNDRMLDGIGLSSLRHRVTAPFFKGADGHKSMGKILGMSFEELRLNPAGFGEWRVAHELDQSRGDGFYYTTLYIKEMILWALRREWKGRGNDLYPKYIDLVMKIEEGKEIWEYLDEYLEVKERFYKITQEIRDEKGEDYENKINKLSRLLMDLGLRNILGRRGSRNWYKGGWNALRIAFEELNLSPAAFGEWRVRQKGDETKGDGYYYGTLFVKERILYSLKNGGEKARILYDDYKRFLAMSPDHPAYQVLVSRLLNAFKRVYTEFEDKGGNKMYENMREMLPELHLDGVKQKSVTPYFRGRTRVVITESFRELFDIEQGAKEKEEKTSSPVETIVLKRLRKTERIRSVLELWKERDNIRFKPSLYERVLGLIDRKREVILYALKVEGCIAAVLFAYQKDSSKLFIGMVERDDNFRRRGYGKLIVERFLKDYGHEYLMEVKPDYNGKSLRAKQEWRESWKKWEFREKGRAGIFERLKKRFSSDERAARWANGRKENKGTLFKVLKFSQRVMRIDGDKSMNQSTSPISYPVKDAIFWAVTAEITLGDLDEQGWLRQFEGHFENPEGNPVWVDIAAVEESSHLRDFHTYKSIEGVFVWKGVKMIGEKKYATGFIFNIKPGQQEVDMFGAYFGLRLAFGEPSQIMTNEGEKNFESYMIIIKPRSLGKPVLKATSSEMYFLFKMFDIIGRDDTWRVKAFESLIEHIKLNDKKLNVVKELLSVMVDKGPLANGGIYPGLTRVFKSEGMPPHVTKGMGQVLIDLYQPLGDKWNGFENNEERRRFYVSVKLLGEYGGVKARKHLNTIYDRFVQGPYAEKSAKEYLIPLGAVIEAIKQNELQWLEELRRNFSGSKGKKVKGFSVKKQRRLLSDLHGVIEPAGIISARVKEKARSIGKEYLYEWEAFNKALKNLETKEGAEKRWLIRSVEEKIKEYKEGLPKGFNTEGLFYEEIAKADGYVKSKKRIARKGNQVVAMGPEYVFEGNTIKLEDKEGKVFLYTVVVDYREVCLLKEQIEVRQGRLSLLDEQRSELGEIIWDIYPNQQDIKKRARINTPKVIAYYGNVPFERNIDQLLFGVGLQYIHSVAGIGLEEITVGFRDKAHPEAFEEKMIRTWGFELKPERKEIKSVEAHIAKKDIEFVRHYLADLPALPKSMVSSPVVEIGDVVKKDKNKRGLGGINRRDKSMNQSTSPISRKQVVYPSMNGFLRKYFKDSILDILKKKFGFIQSLCVLDFGSGDGFFVERFPQTFISEGIEMNLKGIEMNKDLVLAAREKGLDIRNVRVEEAVEFFGEDSQDVVTLFAPTGDIHQWLKQAYRLTRDGGLIIVRLYNYRLGDRKLRLYDERALRGFLTVMRNMFHRRQGKTLSVEFLDYEPRGLIRGHNKTSYPVIIRVEKLERKEQGENIGNIDKSIKILRGESMNQSTSPADVLSLNGFNFRGKFFLEPPLNKGMVGQMFFVSNLFYSINEFLLKINGDRFVLGFWKCDVSHLYHLIKISSTVMGVPEVRFVFFSLKFGYFCHLSTFLFMIESAFRRTHISGRNNTDVVILFLGGYNKKVTSIITLAINKIFVLPLLQDKRFIETGLFYFLSYRLMSGNVINIGIIPVIFFKMHAYSFINQEPLPVISKRDLILESANQIDSQNPNTLFIRLRISVHRNNVKDIVGGIVQSFTVIAIIRGNKTKYQTTSSIPFSPVNWVKEIVSNIIFPFQRKGGLGGGSFYTFPLWFTRQGWDLWASLQPWMKIIFVRLFVKKSLAQSSKFSHAPPINNLQSPAQFISAFLPIGSTVCLSATPLRISGSSPLKAILMVESVLGDPNIAGYDKSLEYLKKKLLAGGDDLLEQLQAYIKGLSLKKQKMWQEALESIFGSRASIKFIKISINVLKNIIPFFGELNLLAEYEQRFMRIARSPIIFEPLGLARREEFIFS